MAKHDLVGSLVDRHLFGNILGPANETTMNRNSFGENSSRSEPPGVLNCFWLVINFFALS